MEKWEDLFTLMAQRDDSDLQCDPELVDRLSGNGTHGREWAYWQGYIEALCDQAGEDVKAVEAAYEKVQEWAAHDLARLDDGAVI